MSVFSEAESEQTIFFAHKSLTSIKSGERKKEAGRWVHVCVRLRWGGARGSVVRGGQWAGRCKRGAKGTSTRSARSVMRVHVYRNYQRGQSRCLLPVDTAEFVSTMTLQNVPQGGKTWTNEAIPWQFSTTSTRKQTNHNPSTNKMRRSRDSLLVPCYCHTDPDRSHARVCSRVRAHGLAEYTCTGSVPWT